MKIIYEMFSEFSGSKLKTIRLPSKLQNHTSIKKLGENNKSSNDLKELL